MGTFGASQIIEFFKNEGIKPKIAIVGEPTGMVPLVGHKGGLEMITEIKGSSGHSSDPRGKVNSIYYAAKLISFIEKVNNDLSLYNKIIPCGIKDKGITSLEKLGVKNYNNIDDVITKNFLNTFL